MNKKILIATVFATLMLTVPMTSVVGVSDVEEDCECQDVNRYDLFRVKLLMTRLKVVTNILLLRFGDIPEVQENCQEILDLINSDRQLDNPIICGILYQLCEHIVSLIWYFIYLSEYVFEENPILINMCNNIIDLLDMIGAGIWFIAVGLDCDWADPYPQYS